MVNFRYGSHVTAIVIFFVCLSFFSYRASSVQTVFKGDENFYYDSVANMVKTGDYVTPVYRGTLFGRSGR